MAELQLPLLINILWEISPIMKTLVVVLALVASSFAFDVHATSRVAKAGYKAAKFVTYPTRHPKKDFHAASKVVKFAAKQAF